MIIWERRVTMNDPFKIKLAADQYPACFVAYDLIYDNGTLTVDLPLMERKRRLNELIIENRFISISRYVENFGIQLYDGTKEKGLEGIVAKRKQSLYFFGKESKDWIKCKHMQDDDFVVCGYIPKANHMTSLIIGQYKENQLVYKGHVTLGVRLRTLYEYKPKSIDYSPFGFIPEGNKEAVWLEPNLVCIVQSMPSEKEGLRQPVFKGFRDDKSPKECQITMKF